MGKTNIQIKFLNKSKIVFISFFDIQTVIPIDYELKVNNFHSIQSPLIKIPKKIEF